MRVEVLHIAGPVPVKRQGSVEVGSLPDATRAVVQHAIDVVCAHERASHKAPAALRRGPAPTPDVGSSIVRIEDDAGEVIEIRVSDAEATLEQARLLKALRPYLTIVPWK